MIGVTSSRGSNRKGHRLDPARRNRFAVLALAASGSVASMSLAQQQITWTHLGTTESWNTATNWNPNVVPTGGAFANFSTGQAGAYNLVLDTNPSVSGMSFSVNFYTLNPQTTQSLTLVNNATINVANAVTATINFALAGSVGMTKTSQGTLVLGGASTYTGLTTISRGTITLAANNALPANDIVFGPHSSGSPAVLQLGTFNQTVDNLYLDHLSSGDVNTVQGTTGVLTVNKNIVRAVGNDFATTIQTGVALPNQITMDAGTKFSSADLVFTGVISGAGGFTKVNRGVASFSANNTLMGSVGFSQGTMVLSGAAGAFSATSQIAALGGTLTVVNSPLANSDRFNDSANISFGGGAIQFGSPAAQISEAMAAMSFDRGMGLLTLSTGTSGLQARANVTNVTRSNRASGLIRGSLLGNSGSYGAPSMTTSYFKISDGTTNEPAFIAALVGTATTAYAASTMNMPIVPWLIGDRSVSESGRTFLTYIGTNGVGVGTTGPGFIALQTSNYDTTVPAGATDRNVRLTATSSPGSATTINSLVLDGGSLTGTGLVSITSGAIVLITDGTISTGVRGGTGATELIVSPIATLNAAGSLTTSAGLTKAGVGTLILGADNSSTLSGDVYINAGTLQISADNQLGNAANNLVLSGGTLNWTGSSVVLSRPFVAMPLGYTGISVPASTSITLSTPLAGTASSTGTLGKVGSGSLITGLASSFASSLSVLAGTLELTGDNSAASGSLDLAAGTTRIGADNNFPGGVARLSGGTLQLTAAGTYTKPLSLAFTTSSVLDTQANTATFSGVVSGVQGALTKQGSGAAILTGNNTYTGATTVSAGSLIISSGATQSGGGTYTVGSGANLRVDGTITVSNFDNPVSVASGASLSGVGTINRPVTVSSGGNLSPGNSVGVINIVDDLTLSSGSNYVVEIDTTAPTIDPGDQDMTDVTGGGAVALGGANLVFVFAPVTVGATSTPVPVVIIRNDGTDAVTGSFAGLTRGGGSDSALFDNGLLKFTVYYSFNSTSNATTGGNDIAVDIESVPEPTAFAGLAALAGIGLRRRRFRK